MRLWVLLKSPRECGPFCFSRQSYQVYTASFVLLSESDGSSACTIFKAFAMLLGAASFINHSGIVWDLSSDLYGLFLKVFSMLLGVRSAHAHLACVSSHLEMYTVT